MATKGWQRCFEHPIPLPRVRQLVTLLDAATYIMKLPKAEQRHTEWQTALEAPIMAAEGRGPLIHACTSAAYGLFEVEPVFEAFPIGGLWLAFPPALLDCA